MDSGTLTQAVKAKAQELGFGLVGVTDAQPPAHMDMYRRWLAAGRYGDMAYLASERAVQRRADLRSIVPDCKSVLVLGMRYDSQLQATKHDAAVGRVAAYACSEDYHQALRPKLKALMSFIEEQVGYSVSNRWYTDSGPVLERELAQRAGLGWIGKNSMLIHPEHGSYFLLAEILLSIELQIDTPLDTDHCGTCTRCLEACPTQCILPDRTIDATRCISYLTIEQNGSAPAELRPQMGEWVFGCDICQAVCPWNERFATNADTGGSEDTTPWVELEKELKINTRDFNRKFKHSPVQRAKRRGYLRNLAVAAGNSGQRSLTQALTVLLQDKEPLARGHAAWALGCLGGGEPQTALAQAAEDELDDWVREEIHHALGKAEN